MKLDMMHMRSPPYVRVERHRVLDGTGTSELTQPSTKYDIDPSLISTLRQLLKVYWRMKVICMERFD